jgi:hypothetical protein
MRDDICFSSTREEKKKTEKKINITTHHTPSNHSIFPPRNTIRRAYKGSGGQHSTCQKRSSYERVMGVVRLFLVQVSEELEFIILRSLLTPYGSGLNGREKGRAWEDPHQRGREKGRFKN